MHVCVREKWVSASSRTKGKQTELVHLGAAEGVHVLELHVLGRSSAPLGRVSGVKTAGVHNLLDNPRAEDGEGNASNSQTATVD